MEIPDALYPRLAGINYESMVDGEGVRAVIFFSGCSHHCPGCQNEEAQDPAYGKACTLELIQEIAAEIAKRPFLSGITLSGGDPLYNPMRTACFLVSLEREMIALGQTMPDVWLYTGYVLNDVLASHNRFVPVILRYVHFLVDGRFESSLADKTLAFRGSSNQKLWENVGGMGTDWYDATDYIDRKTREGFANEGDDILFKFDNGSIISTRKADVTRGVRSQTLEVFE